MCLENEYEIVRLKNDEYIIKKKDRLPVYCNNLIEISAWFKEEYDYQEDCRKKE